MTTPTASPAFTSDQLARIDRHTRDLDREIAARCTEQREIAGHALTVIATTTHPGVQYVHVQDIRGDGQFGRVWCEVDGHREDVPVGPQITSALSAMFRRLPDGPTGVWQRDPLSVVLDVTLALALGDRYPYLPVQDRLVAYLEGKTSRSIRRIEIDTELSSAGYCYSDTVAVDYRDGDSDDIYVDDMGDFIPELRDQVPPVSEAAWTGTRLTARGIQRRSPPSCEFR